MLLLQILLSASLRTLPTCVLGYEFALFHISRAFHKVACASGKSLRANPNHAISLDDGYASNILILAEDYVDLRQHQGGYTVASDYTALLHDPA